MLLDDAIRYFSVVPPLEEVKSFGNCVHGCFWTLRWEKLRGYFNKKKKKETDVGKRNLEDISRQKETVLVGRELRRYLRGKRLL